MLMTGATPCPVSEIVAVGGLRKPPLGVKVVAPDLEPRIVGVKVYVRDMLESPPSFVLALGGISHPLNCDVVNACVTVGANPAGAAGNEPVQSPPSLLVVEVSLIVSVAEEDLPRRVFPKVSDGVTDIAAVSPWQSVQSRGAYRGCALASSQAITAKKLTTA
jgi:hypothetical protein